MKNIFTIIMLSISIFCYGQNMVLKENSQVFCKQASYSWVEEDTVRSKPKETIDTKVVKTYYEEGFYYNTSTGKIDYVLESGLLENDGKLNGFKRYILKDTATGPLPFVISGSEDINGRVVYQKTK